MTLTELYDKIGGNLTEVIARFGNEARINRFLPMFLKDPSYTDLEKSIEAKDWKTAFRAAHTLKGVAANMSFTKLYDAASDLTEALRPGKPLEDYELFSKVSENYLLTSTAVSEYNSQ